SKVFVVLNGIDLTRFLFRRRKPPSPPRVLFVGQLIREKGVRTLLDAVRILNDSNVKFYIAGQGAQRMELERYIIGHLLPNVFFLGQVYGIAEIYLEANLVVVPSEWAE